MGLANCSYMSFYKAFEDVSMGKTSFTADIYGIVGGVDSRTIMDWAVLR